MQITKYTSQAVHNMSFDDELKNSTIIPVETDGTNLRRAQTKQVATKITTVGTDTYIAVSPIGTSQSSALWQAKKVSVSGSYVTITWAGSGEFNQIADDLTALIYV